MRLFSGLKLKIAFPLIVFFVMALCVLSLIAYYNQNLSIRYFTEKSTIKIAQSIMQLMQNNDNITEKELHRDLFYFVSGNPQIERFVLLDSSLQIKLIRDITNPVVVEDTRSIGDIYQHFAQLNERKKRILELDRRRQVIRLYSTVDERTAYISLDNANFEYIFLEYSFADFASRLRYALGFGYLMVLPFIVLFTFLLYSLIEKFIMRKIYHLNKITLMAQKFKSRIIKEVGRPAMDEIDEFSGALRGLLAELQSKEGEINAIHLINGEIVKKSNMNDLLKMLTEMAVENLGAERGILTFCRDGRDEIKIEVSRQHDPKEEPEATMQQCEAAIHDWVMREKRALKIDNIAQYGHFLEIKDSLPPHALLCVPLMVLTQPVGSLILCNSVGNRAFSDDEFNTLFGMVSQVSVALENEKLTLGFKALFKNTIKSLTAAIDAKDPYTRGHSERVAIVAVIIAKELGLSQELIDTIELSALLHDIGKIGIHENIVGKPGRLTDDEFDAMKEHPVKGAKILSKVDALTHIIPGVYHHHERWDGQGYPMGLSQYEIPLLARIIAIADSFDAMTSTRSYRQRRSITYAIRELNEHSGQQFDPDLVRAFVQAVKDNKLMEYVTCTLMDKDNDGADETFDDSFVQSKMELIHHIDSSIRSLEREVAVDGRH
jgi:putative nucleotidyltransferase with HDIG domain